MNKRLIKLVILIMLFLNLISITYACEQVYIERSYPAYPGTPRPKGYDAYVGITVTAGSVVAWTFEADSPNVGIYYTAPPTYGVDGSCYIGIYSNIAGNYHIAITGIGPGVDNTDEEVFNLVVNEVGSVSVVPTVVPVEEGHVTFTAITNPSHSLLALEWQAKYSEDGSSWGGYGSVGAGFTPTPPYGNPTDAIFASAGFYRVRARNGSNDNWQESDVVASVKVKKIDIEYSSGNWDNVTDGDATIVILKGTKYNFRALPNPSGATWPSEKPVWMLDDYYVGDADHELLVTFNSAGTRVLNAGYGTNVKSVTINVVEPQPDQISFIAQGTDQEHSIYGINDPVWKRVSNPDNPASYTKNKYIKINAKFWAPSTLSYDTEVYIDVEAPSFPFLSDSLTFKSWPSGTSTHRSNNVLANQITTHNLTLTWFYKVPSGTNVNIPMGTTGPHKIYAVYDKPKCSSSYYTEGHLDLCCSWANGGVLVTENDIPHKVQHALPYNFQMGTVLSNPWEIIDQNKKAECSTHARLMAEALKVLGINADMDRVGETRSCFWHGTEWHTFMETGSLPVPTNFEGVCSVSLIDESPVWTCYYDIAMQNINGSDGSSDMQKGNHTNMWTEWLNNFMPPPHHKVIYQYRDWENHLPPI